MTAMNVRFICDTYRNRPYCDTVDIVNHFRWDKIMCWPQLLCIRIDLVPVRKLDRTFHKLQPMVDVSYKWWFVLHAINYATFEHNTLTKNCLDHYVYIHKCIKWFFLYSFYSMVFLCKFVKLTWSVRLKIKLVDCPIILMRSINVFAVHPTNYRIVWISNESIATYSKHCRSK